MDFQIYADTGFRGRKSLTILAPDGSTEAYFIDFRNPGPSNLSVHRGTSSGAPIARIEFHKWHKHTDIEFLTPGSQRQTVEMRPESWSSKTQLVNLPAAGNVGPFQWKATHEFGKLKSGDLKLVDSKGMVLATFERKTGWGKGGLEGTVRLCVDMAPEMRDQMFTTFVAVMEKQRRSRQAAAAGAAGGAAGAA